MMGFDVYRASRLAAAEHAREMQTVVAAHCGRRRTQRGAAMVTLRGSLSLALRRLADAVEPAREALEPRPIR